jgi:ATP-dependent Lon protease
VLAAHRAGIKTIILPAWNRKDLEDIPKKVEQDIQFHFVDKMQDVLMLALENKKSRMTKKSPQKSKASATKTRRH